MSFTFYNQKFLSILFFTTLLLIELEMIKKTLTQTTDLGFLTEKVQHHLNIEALWFMLIKIPSDILPS